MARRTGRKVYRNSVNAKKKRAKKVAGVFISILAILVLVFIGYSIAKPIYNYFSTESNNQEQVLPWTPPVAETPENDSENQENKTEENIASSDNDSQPVSEEKTSDKNIENGFTAYKLPEDALTSQSKLNAYIDQAKSEGYNAVLVTMKSEGGKINYASESEFAAKDENVIAGTLTAKQIADSIKSNDMYALAVINTLEDNNRYGENRDGSYHALDGSTWLDNSVANGGKPWLSPFDNDTVSYVAFLVNEVTTAGFDAVVNDGLSFPPFRNSDLNLIGDTVKSSDRNKALINVLNVSNSVTSSRQIENILTVNAADIINGREEVFAPHLLDENYPVIVEFLTDEFNTTIVYNNQEIVLSDLSDSEKFDVILTIIKELSANKLKLIPSIRHNDYDQAEFDKIITILINEGYSAYIVQ